MSDRKWFSNEKNNKNNQKPTSLYDKLQENKAIKQAEFYEETKEGCRHMKDSK